MGVTFEEQLKFMKQDAAKRANPCTSCIAAFTLLQACLQDQGYTLKRGSRELQAAAYAVRSLLSTIRVLDRQLGACFHSVLTRAKMAKGMWLLDSNYIDHDDIVSAMDFANRMIQEMLEVFDAAILDRSEFESKFKEEFEQALGSRRDQAEAQWQLKLLRTELELARHSLAAFLPMLSERMKEVWLPLKKRMASARRHAM